jgi:hypothetical protein
LGYFTKCQMWTIIVPFPLFSMAPRYIFPSYPGNDATSREYQKYNQRLRGWFTTGFVCIAIVPMGLCYHKFGVIPTTLGAVAVTLFVYLFYRFGCKVPRRKSEVELKADEYAHRCCIWFLLVYLLVVARLVWRYYHGHEVRVLSAITGAMAVMLYITYRFVRRRLKDMYLDDNRK